MDALDTKMGVLFAFGGGEAALALAALALPRPPGSPILLLVAVGLIFTLSYLTLAYWALACLRLGEARIGPQLEYLGSRYAQGDAPRLLKARVIKTLRDDYLYNERQVSRRKRTALTVAYVALVVETVAVVLACLFLVAASLFPTSSSSTAPAAGSPTTGSPRPASPTAASAARQSPASAPRQPPSSP